MSRNNLYTSCVMISNNNKVIVVFIKPEMAFDIGTFEEKYREIIRKDIKGGNIHFRFKHFGVVRDPTHGSIQIEMGSQIAYREVGGSWQNDAYFYLSPTIYQQPARGDVIIHRNMFYNNNGGGDRFTVPSMEASDFNLMTESNPSSVKYDEQTSNLRTAASIKIPWGFQMHVDFAGITDTYTEDINLWAQYTSGTGKDTINRDLIKGYTICINGKITPSSGVLQLMPLILPNVANALGVEPTSANILVNDGVRHKKLTAFRIEDHHPVGERTTYRKLYVGDVHVANVFCLEDDPFQDFRIDLRENAYYPIIFVNPLIEPTSPWGFQEPARTDYSIMETLYTNLGSDTLELDANHSVINMTTEYTMFCNEYYPRLCTMNLGDITSPLLHEFVDKILYIYSDTCLHDTYSEVTPDDEVNQAGDNGISTEVTVVLIVIPLILLISFILCYTESNRYKKVTER